MNDFESDELVVGTRAADDEEEGGVTPVHDLGVPVFEEVAHARAPSEDELGDVFYDFGFVFWGEGCEPFCEALSRSSVCCACRYFEGCYIRLCPASRAG